MAAPAGATQGAAPGGDALSDFKGDNTYGGVHYWFRFVPNGSGTPTGVQGRFVTSITHSATGLWKVQFASNFGSILGFDGSVQSVSGGNGCGYQVTLDNSLVSLNAASPGAVIGVATQSTIGTYADITADSNLMVYCHLVVSNNTGLSP